MKSSRSFAASGYAGGIIALATLLVCLVAINILSGGIRLRYDLTEEKLYTLSEGTHNILNRLDRPVTLTFYFSRSLSEIPAPINIYARRVEDLLHEYDRAGGDRLRVETVDPRPDTESEEWAISHGIEGHPIDRAGNRLFMGLTVVSGDTRAVIPMLNPNEEETLEYDITRRILRVSRDVKPVIGLISRLPVMGQAAMPFMMPGMPQQNNQQPWTAFQELERDFTVRELALPLDTVEADVECLLLAHPPEMDEGSLLAIDQYLLGGGAVIAFLDPLSVAEREIMDDTPSPYGQAHESASALEPLTTAWGVKWNVEELVVDIEAATPVRGAGGRIEDNPILLSLFEDAFDANDIVTTGLEQILLPLAGHFEVIPVDQLEYHPIIESSANVMSTDPMTAQFGMHAFMQQFQPRQEPFTLALRVQGTFKTAFPSGITVTEGVDSSEFNALDDNDFPDTNASDGAPDKPVQRLPKHTQSVQPGVVLLIGNVDMLYDAYAVRQIPFFGVRTMQPINDNINFLLNAVEQASGGIDLLAMRARGRSTRPFTRVQELERAARLRWVDEEQRLQQQLRDTEQRLHALRAETDDAQHVFLTEEQRREIERFREEQARTQAALREVRKNLREDIERLGLRLKIINIGLVPLLVILGGIAIALIKHIKLARSK